MVQVVILSANGESRCSRTQAFPVGGATGALVAKMLRKTKPLELVGTWPWGERTLQLWGAKEGKAGTENKHELPPPHDEVLLFGDSVIVDATGELTLEVWSEFYDAAFGGFEELGTEDTEDDAEEADEEEEPAEEGAEEAGEEEEEEEEEAEEADDEEADEEDGDEAEDVDGDYDDDGGGAKKRTNRRRTTDSEYRRIEMGNKVRVKFAIQTSKRLPRWMTAPELEAEPYELA